MPRRLVRSVITARQVAAGRRRRAALWRSAVIALCDGLTAELTAGRSPEGALAATVAVLDPQVAEALLHPAADRPADPGQPPPETGVPALLERTAGRPGAEGLRLVAACWRVGAQSGGTFAAALEGVGAALREQEAHRLEVGAQLAGARASARLLAGLPLLGLVLATALGARPLAFLLGTPYGAACLVTGAGLDGLGWWWTCRLASAAEGP